MNAGQKKSLRGKRFGKLTVLKQWGKRKNGTYHLCQCRCGNKTIVRGDRLKDRKTKSCGCLQIDMARAIIRNTTQRQQEMQEKISLREG